VGDPSLGVCIPGTGVANARRSTDSVLDSGKGKEMAALTGVRSRSSSQPQHIDVEVSLEDDIPLQRSWKVSCGSGSAHGGPPVMGLQGSKVAAVPQVDLGAGVSLMTETSGSGSDESTTPSEGAVGAIAGSIDDAVAKEATPK
jgi:hypothetical protein